MKQFLIFLNPIRNTQKFKWYGCYKDLEFWRQPPRYFFLGYINNHSKKILCLTCSTYKSFEWICDMYFSVKFFYCDETSQKFSCLEIGAKWQRSFNFLCLYKSMLIRINTCTKVWVKLLYMPCTFSWFTLFL